MLIHEENLFFLTWIQKTKNWQLIVRMEIALSVVEYKPSTKRKLWVKPCLQSGPKLGVFNTLLQKMKLKFVQEYIPKTFLCLSEPNKPLSFWKPSFFTNHFDIKKTDLMYKDHTNWFDVYDVLMYMMYV